MPVGIRRRRIVVALAALFMNAGCSEKPVVFHSTDITGAKFGSTFRLSDPDGRERTLADFQGRWVMLFFGFTQCPDVCPTALIRAVEIRRLLGDKASALQVVFVTIDPERDTATVLKQYTTAFDPSFLGLWSDLDGTREVANEFRIFYEKVPTKGSYTMNHSSISYLIDPAGRIRLAIPHSQSAADCAADLRGLMQST